ncbi:PLP-dependent transferase [Mycena floridula]|nr:PLP-dependent transferase [Mycena floridula]
MAPTNLVQKLSSSLATREREQIRFFPPQESDALCIDFATNDYIGLSQSPDFRDSFMKQLTVSPSLGGSGGSAVVITTKAHISLEERLAKFFKVPAAFLTTAGTLANLGIFSALPQQGDIIVYDEYVHASVHSGMRQSRASHLVPFAHNNIAAFEGVLRKLMSTDTERSGDESIFIVVDGVYSMDGTIPPLIEMVRLIDEILPEGNGHLVVDEAHSAGIYGPEGRGIVAMLGLEDKCLARVITFGKALGGSGAAILSTSLVREYLLNYSRPIMFTTSPSYPNIISMNCAIDLLEDGTASRESKLLLQNCVYAVESLHHQLANIDPSILRLSPYTNQSLQPTPVIPILTPYSQSLRAYLLQHGVDTSAIFSPVVPKDKERIRVSMHSFNSKEEISKLVELACQWARDFNVSGASEVKPKL